MFDGSIHTETVVKDLKTELGEAAEVPVEGFSGIRVECGDTECIFEFVTYKYNGEKRKEEEEVIEQLPNNDVPTSPPSNIERSLSLPAPALAEALGHHILQSLISSTVLASKTTPPLVRSNTVDGSLSRHTGSAIFSPPPGSDVFPNSNIPPLMEEEPQEQQNNNRRGSDEGSGVGRRREKGLQYNGSRGSRLRYYSGASSGFGSSSQSDSFEESTSNS